MSSPLIYGQLLVMLTILHTYQPMKMEETECSETSAYNIQAPGNCPEESIQHSEQGENLKSRIMLTNRCQNPSPMPCIYNIQNMFGNFLNRCEVILSFGSHCQDKLSVQRIRHHYVPTAKRLIPRKSARTSSRI